MGTDEERASTTEAGKVHLGSEADNTQLQSHAKFFICLMQAVKRQDHMFPYRI
jgi:hypothetical protein